MDKLNDVKVAFLGKKGQLSSLLKGMKDVAPEDRPKVGQMVNDARDGICLLYTSKEPVSKIKEWSKSSVSFLRASLKSPKSITISLVCPSLFLSLIHISQVYAKPEGEVYGLTPARCWKVKGRA